MKQLIHTQADTAVKFRADVYGQPCLVGRNPESDWFHRPDNQETGGRFLCHGSWKQSDVEKLPMIQNVRPV